MRFSNPQYEHFKELAPGENWRPAPQWLHGYSFSPDCVASDLIYPGYACGGSGGGTSAKMAVKAATLPAGVHWDIPCVHTRVSRVNRPAPAWDARVCRSNGPLCWPLTATK